MEEPPVRGAAPQKISHLEISLREPNEDFLLELRETQPRESVVPLTLLFLIEKRRSDIAEQFDLFKRQADQQADNETAQNILEKTLKSLKETKEQLRRHYSEWCWLQLKKVYSDLGIGGNHVTEDAARLSITIRGLSAKDRISFCQKAWHMEFIDRIATDDLFVLLDPDQLDEELQRIPNWTPDERRVSVIQTFKCSNADAACSFAAEATRLSKLWRQDPLINNNKHEVTITVTTPSVKGLTPENIQYASSLSTIYTRRYSC
ncbi:4a-hydroxytetrahydrobiopterin dehydratase [Patescibacteria group bacterium]|nr:4a-hydroxytetrahydrobiopterin dehydratase [Patescibacteria group bacterium]